MKPSLLLVSRLLVFALAAGSGRADGPPGAAPAFAQVGSIVQLTVSPDHADWNYQPGEPVRFHVRLTVNRHAAVSQRVSYAIGPESLPPTLKGEATVQDGVLELEGGTMTGPGFLRCIVTTEIEGRTHRTFATAGFAPDRIRPTQSEPADFDRFWSGEKAGLAAVPLDARLTPMPELSSSTVDAFMVSLQNVGVPSNYYYPVLSSRIYGILCVPRGTGPFPAVLNVPGAGLRPFRGMLDLAEKGFITLQIGIHGIPVNLPAGVYQDLYTGALANYWSAGLEDRMTHYFRRVYLGCLRANDYLVSHPQWDRRNLLVMGGSQGGQLAIVTAALDPRVTGAAAMYPGYCDLTGYLHGRAGGWPHNFRPLADGRPNPHATPEKIATSAYFDAVNFARRLRTPIFLSWGYNDEECAPTSMFAAYNVITAPKELWLLLETVHAVNPLQTERAYEWIIRQSRPAAKN